MNRQTLLSLLLVTQCCEWTVTIQVPTDWNNGVDSEVQGDTSENQEFLVETFPPQVHSQKEIPVEYFEYTANKPKFAVELAAYHGVKSPENHYKSYPIKPYTGVHKPELGKHHMLDPKKEIYEPYQQYTKQSDNANTVVNPSFSEYQAYHPYKEEEAALQEIYKDPVLDKIRNDIRNSKNKLQNYENKAGEPDISKDEYLESPEDTDRKLFPHKNIPAQFEIHRPPRRPIYYRATPYVNNRYVVLNKKFAHPLNHNHKIRPIHYRQLQNHLQRLRQQHAIQYDDENNQYPILPPPQNYAEVPDGYDIYEKGRQKYINLRNNVDESVKEHKPTTYQKLELQNNVDDTSNSDEDDDDEDKEEFVPIKNYAQVRKTETTRHLPKSAAFDDADSIEEIRNAPRLKEAVKSTKAQTVYSEEGYEDAAYDHAGEQKHASDHEGHGGFLTEKEISGGKYKTPTFSGSYEDAKGAEYRDQTLHGEKWNDKNQDGQVENDSEDFAGDENEQSEEIDIYDENDNSADKETDEKSTNERKKRENNVSPNNTNNQTKNFPLKVPEINFRNSFFDVKNNSKLLHQNTKKESLQSKYPYYFKKIENINQDSPLRYSENLKLIPKKTGGGSEFYESRSNFECPDVEEVNPVPEKLENKDKSEGSSSEEVNVGFLKKQERLHGLGDKIDCFKAKYFGENPLDSPFFQESIIANPQPLFDLSFKPDFTNEKLKEIKKLVDFEILPKINNTNRLSKITANPVVSETKSLILETPQSESILLKSASENIALSNTSHVNNRRKRATSFVYEPYKIIRDIPIVESKKTTTLGNVSPLIRQLQSSRIVDTSLHHTNKEQPVKRNAVTRKYKEIKKQDRETQNKEDNSDIVDVSIDKRRGEPRYEVRHSNHKKEYTPVKKRSSISAEDYKAQTLTGNTQTRPSKLLNNDSLKTRHEHTDDESKSKKSHDSSPEYYDADDDTVTEEVTTFKPIFRRRNKVTTTTLKPESEEVELPKLRLITRFNKPIKNEQSESEIKILPKSTEPNENNEKTSPQYREKKKKSSKSTIVTDTKSYGEDNNDMREAEIDALIGVKQDMSEYTPQYEKEIENPSTNTDSDENNEDYDSNEEDSSEEVESEEDEEDEEDVDEDDEDEKIIATTPEPPKRSLVMTTDAPVSTTEAKTAKLQIKPVVVRKKIEIHKETPVNKSAPYRSQYKQDIKEVEIIKEMPKTVLRRKPNKHVEVFDLYRDENLAKNINKLGDVEVFKQNINMKQGPRHGGNYRSAKIVELSENPKSRKLHGGNYRSRKNDKEDAETSQSKNEKLELQNSSPRRMHGGNLKSNSDYRSSEEDYGDSDHTVVSNGQGNKPLESNEHEQVTEETRSSQNTHAELKEHVKPKIRIRIRTKDDRKSAKVNRNSDKDELTEISENNASVEDSSGRRARKKAATVLNSFAQAVPVLTTTPAYIIDPSKRMYYYVEK